MEEWFLFKNVKLRETTMASTSLFVVRLHTTVLNWASNCIFTSQRVLSLPHKFVIAKFRMAGTRRLGKRTISDSEPSCLGGGTDVRTGYGGRLTCHERLSEDKWYPYLSSKGLHYLRGSGSLLDPKTFRSFSNFPHPSLWDTPSSPFHLRTTIHKA